jgi:hypothetical protein
MNNIKMIKNILKQNAIKDVYGYKVPGLPEIQDFIYDQLEGWDAKVAELTKEVRQIALDKNNFRGTSWRMDSLNKTKAAVVKWETVLEQFNEGAGEFYIINASAEIFEVRLEQTPVYAYVLNKNMNLQTAKATAFVVNKFDLTGNFVETFYPPSSTYPEHCKFVRTDLSIGFAVNGADCPVFTLTSEEAEANIADCKATFLICKDCQEIFMLSVNEKAWFAKKDLTPPKRCSICRDEKKKLEAQRVKAERQADADKNVVLGATVFRAGCYMEPTEKEIVEEENIIHIKAWWKKLYFATYEEGVAVENISRDNYYSWLFNY